MFYFFYLNEFGDKNKINQDQFVKVEDRNTHSLQTAE